MPQSETTPDAPKPDHVPAVLAGDSWDKDIAPPSDDDDAPDDGASPPAKDAAATPDPDPQTDPDPDTSADPDADKAAADDAPDKTDKTDDTADKELPHGAVKSLERARRQRREAQAEAEALKAENARLKAESEARKKADKIDMNDFDTMEEYEAAVAEAIKIPEPAAQADGELAVAITDIREACEDLNPDLVDKMMDEGFHISSDMILAVADDPDPGAIIEHFVANPAEREKILAMKPRAQERAIIRLGDRLAREQGASPAPAPKPADPAPPAGRKASEAPPPIDPVGGRSPQTLTIETAKTQREFEEARAREAGSGKFFDW